VAIAAFRDFQKVGAEGIDSRSVLNISFRSSLQVKHNIKNYEDKEKEPNVSTYLFFSVMDGPSGVTKAEMIRVFGESSSHRQSFNNAATA
jgi:hypothetical protein